MSKSDKVLTSKYLDWHTKLTGLPSVLTDRIQFSLYKKYKKETRYEPWQLSEVYASEAGLLINSKPENKVSDLSFSEQCKKKRAYHLRSQTQSRINYQIRLRAFHIPEILK